MRAASLRGAHDFNPRSCERSDKENDNQLPYRVISIHAPARGATALIRLLFLLPAISIHAPARGATAKITYFSQNKDLCLGNTNNTQHYPNVQAKFKYEMLPIYLLSLVRTSL